MVRDRYLLFILASLIFCCQICTLLGFDFVDNYLVDCGSQRNTTVGGRIFLADNFSSSTLSTPEELFVNASLGSNLSTFGSALYRTARIFRGASQYNFSIRTHGRHWIRLHFFPFPNPAFNLSTARFSVSAQNFTLLKDFQPVIDEPIVKEYSLNISTNSLLLKFAPSGNSFAFLNALELISLPDELIPTRAEILDSQGRYQYMSAQALETVARVNMGNRTVFPQNDTLWRHWISDIRFLNQENLVQFVSNISAVNYTSGGASQYIAPASVYGTATKLQSQPDPNTKINATWTIEVDPGFDYFIRFHFCDIASAAPGNMLFSLFLNSWYAARDIDLSRRTSNVLGTPYYIDIIAKLRNDPKLNVSVGTSSLLLTYPDGILNGLEVMKISNSRGSLHAADAEIQLNHSGKSTNKTKRWLIVGSAVGAVFLIMVLALVSFLFCRRRRRTSHVGHSPQDQFAIQVKHLEVNRYSDESSVFSRSKIGYRFPFAAVQEATDNFSESLIIGIGGFGKVYKGVLGDNTQVAIKRGAPQSRQGLAEFKTEIELLSQFRHRHLVSLIGYCDDRNEMIIIYEYMKNGTLKNHLYGSGLPKLNWRQRLEICIGAARGLHYLHTGSDKAIIHRDVKSANILLDENLMAKVADFGISKTGPEIDQTHVSTAVKGSFGYLDPEYLTRQQLTEKSDVYSFGVVMLEILSGRPVIDPSLPREMVNMVEWAMKCLRRGEVEQIADPHLLGDVKPDSLKKYAETAEKCLAECGADRPSMGDVLWNLEYALQLQGPDERLRGVSEPSSENHQLDASIVSSTQYSMGSMALGDLAGVSMSKVFSEMVRAEMG